MQGKLYIQGQWCDASGESFTANDPATGQPAWTGGEATRADVDQAVRAARAVAEAWSDTPLAIRIEIAERFAEALGKARDDMVDVICRETGKPRWESQQEVNAMIGKVGLSIRAYHERRATVRQTTDGVHAVLRFKPHGVVAVLGPFNLPGHLPNGHIVPALIAGNTVVFKPSEKTPGVGEAMVRVWSGLGLPPGVINLVQGRRDTGAALVKHAEVDGVYFTGGTEAGLAIQRVLIDQPHRILALEMGGNNPLVVGNIGDVDAAVLMTLQSAYLTAGQRCTCARRLIVVDGAASDAFMAKLIAAVGAIRVGRYTDDPEPFMGPVVSPQAAERLLEAQASLLAAGAASLVKLERIGTDGAMLRPGLIDVSNVSDRPDVELFGPLLQVYRVRDLDAAVTEANRTRYGLVAGLLSDDAQEYETFYRRARAGVINWNRPTNGASGALPFGGIGLSGNHRPAGYWAADYCSYPVASLETEHLNRPAQLPPGIVI